MENGAQANASAEPDEMYELIRELYPICRSITGDGVRETLRILSRHVPLTIHEVPTGTPVLDWTVPREWNVRDAWIKDAQGRRVVDFAASNLHVMSYSMPVRATMRLGELRSHLHVLPDRPDSIPYRTSYYAENWGICLSARQLEAMPDGEYEVCIDSTLAPGSLTYGEFALPGESSDEILISTHVCHPSLCDDNLSGIAVSVFLAKRLMASARRSLGMRFLYAPGTIGAITWLARNRANASRVRHGLTLTCLGDAHPFTYKRTVHGDAPIDRACEHVLSSCGFAHQVIDFFPYGYDERQYNSPGFRLPVGSLMRGRHGEFPEYHTSADNLEFVQRERLAESLTVLSDIIGVLQGNGSYVNLEPYGEVQLGRRGLYGSVGGDRLPKLQLAVLWVLNLSDGGHDLLEIARRARMPFETIRAAADLLVKNGLLRAVKRGTE